MLDDSLRELCGSLLLGAIGDAESSVGRITRLFGTLRSSLTTSTERRPECRVETIAVLDALVQSLQFFDEHAQRIHHVVAILELLGSSFTEAGAGFDKKSVRDRVRDLLSTQGEWELFAESALGEGVMRPDNAATIELFQ